MTHGTYGTMKPEGHLACQREGIPARAADTALQACRNGLLLP
jgi:hypothetical protein